MTSNLTWSFPQFDVAPTEDGLDNVVKTIHWRLDAVDGAYSAGAYGSVAVDAPDPSSFVPYSQITPQWTIDAVLSKINFDEVKQALENQIALKKNPPVLPMVPPFSAIISS
jgi:hypothetical protein